MAAKNPDKEEIEMSVTEDGDLLEKFQAENQAEISLEYNEEQPSDKNPQQREALSGGLDEGIAVQTGNDLPPEKPQEAETNGFAGLDDDEIADMLTEQQPETEDHIPDKKEAQKKTGETAAETVAGHDSFKENIPLKEAAEKTPGAAEAPGEATGFSLVNKLISGTLLALIIAGFVVYHHPSLIGLTKAQEPTTPAPVKTGEAVAPVVPPMKTPAAPDIREQCLAKIEEAARLRNLLLEKNEEIYDLDLHYRRGIAELVEETHQLLKQAGATAYEAAMKNRRIELNMRTIQRRQAYINGLVKPAFWLNSGSEELFYLIRKARLDLQLTDIAGGIDLKKHMRHIDAAIQKYRPSPDKLAVDPQQSKVSPLEEIWEQVSRNEPVNGLKEKKEQFALNPKDRRITNEICSGNYERISELTHISSEAAGCLARMSGSDLFLNGLTTLSPDAAEQLFQWRGNWICLNGVKRLSPAAAQYLFKWKGNWISLNSLSDFPPELAEQLLQWEGQQLELMGLKYKEDEATLKSLKFLALWETTGGKLFVTDKVRQKIKRLM